MISIEIESSISQSEFTKYWIVKFFKNKQTIFLVIALIVTLIFSILHLLPSFFIQLALMIFFVIPAFLVFKSISAYKKNEVINLPTTFTFGENEVSMKSSFIDKSMAYNKLIRIESDQDFLLIFLSATAALFVNQKSIANSGQKEALLDLLKTSKELSFIEK